MVKPECFYRSFEEEWNVKGKYHKTKGYELSVVNQRKLSKAYSFHLVSLCLQRKDIRREPLTGALLSPLLWKKVRKSSFLSQITSA